MTQHREKITAQMERADDVPRVPGCGVPWEHVRRDLESLPPLTREQIEEIAAIAQPILRRMRDAAA